MFIIIIEKKKEKQAVIFLKDIYVDMRSNFEYVYIYDV